MIHSTSGWIRTRRYPSRNSKWSFKGNCPHL